MAKIEINKSDLKSLESLLSGIKNGVNRVLSNSINKSIKTTQVQAVKIIGQDLNLSAKRIKEDFKQDKANFSKLRGGLIAAGDPVGLINFQARQVGKGVSFKVKKAGSRSLLLHAYIGAGKKGSGKHVFRRDYKGPRKPAVPGRAYGAMPKSFRLPTSRLTGPRIEDIYSKPEVYDQVQKLASDAYVKNIGIETQSLLRRFA